MFFFRLHLRDRNPCCIREEFSLFNLRNCGDLFCIAPSGDNRFAVFDHGVGLLGKRARSLFLRRIVGHQQPQML